jgi:hypothetical protein
MTTTCRMMIFDVDNCVDTYEFPNQYAADAFIQGAEWNYHRVKTGNTGGLQPYYKLTIGDDFSNTYVFPSIQMAEGFLVAATRRNPDIGLIREVYL